MKDNNESASTPLPEDAFTSPKTPIKKRKVRSTSAVSAPVMNEAVNLLRSIQSKKKEKDEYDSFGEQVAIKLRKITSPQARFEAQQIINKTLFEAEMGMAGYSYNANTHQQTFPNIFPSTNQNYQPQLSPYPLTQSPTLNSQYSSSSFSASQSPSSVRSDNISNNLGGQLELNENEIREFY